LTLRYNQFTISRGQFFLNHRQAKIMAIGLDVLAMNLASEFSDLYLTFRSIALTQPISYNRSMINLIVASSRIVKLVSKIDTSCIRSASIRLCSDVAGTLTIG
jgi:ABC-type transport system involved in Fe-S cluster assembly fused permease/ATPase subunit